ncbi:DNA-binding helix-turn-helix protein [uncultured Paludibacter sp.]|nr:DNA-binding helix-turn-helix protein [uncultured Paludibacter sp.]
MELRIKEICKEKGITIGELAEKIGMMRESLSRTINGNPTLESLEKISNALDVPITELFAQKQPIFGVIILNGITHRIESFEQLEALCATYKEQ